MTPPPPDTRANSRNLIEIEGFLINTFYTLDFKSVGWKLSFFGYYLPSYEENSFIKIKGNAYHFREKIFRFLDLFY